MDLDLPPPILVGDARAFERLLADLESQREIALDTEADSFFNYREKVCLLQITVEDRDYLVDPLAGLDLAPLGRALGDPAKKKVFHDGEYDVLILKRDWGFDFKNLFDTRIAEAALGFQSPGLAAVLKARFGVELDKSMQRSNWSQRPLTERQIRYARLDTRFLLPLMRSQAAELAARGRAMIVEGECRRLERLEPPRREFDPDDFVRLKGARALDPLAQRRLRELFALRNQVAAREDLPPFKVLGNDTLVELARSGPKTREELSRVHAFSPRQARRLGDDVLAALERAAAAGPLPRAPAGPQRDGDLALDDVEFELHERLKRWRTARALREGYDASLVLNRLVLLRLAKAKPARVEDLRCVEGLLDWQVESFGAEIVDVIRRGLVEIPSDGSLRPRRRGPRAG
jgi:ribonuclease D